MGRVKSAGPQIPGSETQSTSAGTRPCHDVFSDTKPDLKTWVIEKTKCILMLTPSTPTTLLSPGDALDYP